jgi:hypothetical protein
MADPTINYDDKLIGKKSPDLDTTLSPSERKILDDIESGKYKNDQYLVEQDFLFAAGNVEDNDYSKSSFFKHKKKQKEKQEQNESNSSKSIRENTAYKYSKNGKCSLNEAVILSGLSVFLKYENGEIISAEEVEESSRIIKPPYAEGYPSEAYEFADMEEVLSFVKRAKEESIDSLYQRAKTIVKKYNDQDEDKQILLSADIIGSYFQDRFSTTHYDIVIGDNESGKSTVGDTFEAVGYRPVNMTDPTAANLFRVLGTIEPGQCTIIADEAEKVDQSLDIMGILKTGYHIKKKIARTNNNTWKQEFFFTYCFKMIIAEKSPSQSNAKGVLDRAFIITTYKGVPEYDIKEVLNPAGDKKRQQLLDELIEFRKLMLIYRLIHFADPIADIDIGIDGRNKELCKPVVQLFYGSQAQKEIEGALQKFIDAKNQRKETTIEAALYPIIANLISQHGNELSASRLWESIKDHIEGISPERKPNEYYTSDYGPIYRNTITNIICDKFGAKRKHKETGNVLIFNLEKVTRAGKVYNTKASIQTKILPMQEKPEDPEGSEGSIKAPTDGNDKQDIESGEDSTQSNKNTQDIAQNTANILQQYDNTKLSTSPEPSVLSETSVITQPNIYRLGHTDRFACKNCSIVDDRWFMEKHICKAQSRK